MAIFQDAFNEVSSVDLEDHTPDVGDSWTLVFSDSAGSGWNVSGTNDRLEGSNLNSAGALYTADATYPSADYEVEITMEALSTGGDNPVYLLIRVQDQENMYAVRLVTQGGSNTCQLYKKVSGSWTALGSLFDPPANGSVVKLEMIGSSLKFYDDTVEIASATDTAITAAGKGGLAIGGGAELVTSTDDISSGNRQDDLTITDRAAAGQPTQPRTQGVPTGSGSRDRIGRYNRAEENDDTSHLRHSAEIGLDEDPGAPPHLMDRTRLSSVPPNFLRRRPDAPTHADREPARVRSLYPLRHESNRGPNSDVSRRADDLDAACVLAPASKSSSAPRPDDADDLRRGG